MAAKKKSNEPAPKKVPLQALFDPKIAFHIKVTALARGQDIGEFLTGLFLEKHSGVHVRGLPGDTGEGQGPPAGSVTVSIPKSPQAALNRIGTIAARAHEVPDTALDSFVKD